MPTIFTHPAVALTKTWFPRVPRRALVTAMFGTVLPDADVAAFALGIPYEHTFGHRGFSHSIAFALLYASLASAVLRVDRRSAAFIFLCTMSHGVLDASTDGGLGVAFFSPVSNERYFFPWTPIRVSPIGTGFFSARGLETLASEVVWVWGPTIAVALLGKYLVERQGEAGKDR